jgi:hypothetical protein
MDLEIRLHWQTRAEAGRRVPPCAGVWFAAGPFRIGYPRGRSRILALGASADLRDTVRRLDGARTARRAAAAGIDNALFAAVLADAQAPVRWSLLALPTLSSGAVEAVAVAAIEVFVRQHGVLPYGCANAPVSGMEAVWEGGVRLVEPASGDGEPLLDAHALARRYGLHCEPREAGPSGLALTLGESDEAAGDLEIVRRDSGLDWPSLAFVHERDGAARALRPRPDGPGGD